MRTIICSDSHGYPSLILTALAGASYVPGRDRFIYAGDLVDRGPDSIGCFELVDELANVVLLGNHDLACALGYEVNPHDAGARVLAKRIQERVLRVHNPWRLAYASGDVLVTHAGVSEGWRNVFDKCGRDVESFAGRLNRAFRADFAAAVAAGSDTWGDGLLGFEGPLWFRPIEDGLPLIGLRQVVGHTPSEFFGPNPDTILGEFGLTFVDPGAYRFADAEQSHGHFKCAVMEEGRVTLLQSERSETTDSEPISLLCY